MKQADYKRIIITVLSFVTFTGCSILAPVDRSKYSDIEGHIFSLYTNSPVANAEITVSEPMSGDKTDRNGKFMIRGIPVDWVNVEIKADGFLTLNRKVRVEPYGNKFIDFWMVKDTSEIKGESIIFERYGDIWLTDEYGVNQYNLTEKLKNQSYDLSMSSSFNFASPVWFENKSKIAYIASDNSIKPTTKNGLWMMNPNGKMSQRLTYLDSQAKGLTLNEKGSNFVFSMINPDNSENIGIYKYTRNSGKIEALSGGVISRDISPKLSPKGNLLVYSSSITQAPNMTSYDVTQYPQQRMEVFSMDINGFGKKQLTVSGENYDPSWSPDGEKIVFVSNRTGSTELWLMNKDGSGQRRLTDTGASRTSNPVWSPDGQKILFNTNYKQKYSSMSSSELWVYEPLTYELHMVTNDAANADW